MIGPARGRSSVIPVDCGRTRPAPRFRELTMRKSQTPSLSCSYHTVAIFASTGLVSAQQNGGPRAPVNTGTLEANAWIHGPDGGPPAHSPLSESIGQRRPCLLSRPARSGNKQVDSRGRKRRHVVREQADFQAIRCTSAPEASVQAHRRAFRNKPSLVIAENDWATKARNAHLAVASINWMVSMGLLADRD